MNLSEEQYEILHHTVHRAANGLYCGGGLAMLDLVAQGLMVSAGQKKFCARPYYRITGAGREALRQRPVKESPPERKLTRSQERWRRYRAVSDLMSFPQFLSYEKEERDAAKCGFSSVRTYREWLATI